MTHSQAATLLPSAHGARHDIYAGRAEVGEVSVQTGLNPAAARLYVRAHRSDVGAAFVRNRGSTEQHGAAWLGQVREMRVKTGPDGATARRHISARGPDVGGAFPYDGALLCHRVCR
jgi:hypothetical protein